MLYQVSIWMSINQKRIKAAVHNADFGDYRRGGIMHFDDDDLWEEEDWDDDDWDDDDW